MLKHINFHYESIKYKFDPFLHQKYVKTPIAQLNLSISHSRQCLWKLENTECARARLNCEPLFFSSFFRKNLNFAEKRCFFQIKMVLNRSKRDRSALVELYDTDIRKHLEPIHADPGKVSFLPFFKNSLFFFHHFQTKIHIFRPASSQNCSKSTESRNWSKNSQILPIFQKNCSKNWKTASWCWRIRIGSIEKSWSTCIRMVSQEKQYTLQKKRKKWQRSRKHKITEIPKKIKQNHKE